MSKKLKIAVFIFLIILTLTAGGCQTKNITTSDLPLIKDEKFGGVYFDITIDDFEKLGFVPGDSVDLKFSNEFELDDVPYYTGYHVRVSDPLIIAIPGYPYIKFQYNYYPEAWTISKASEEDTGRITLHTAGKFKDVEETFNQKKSDNREDYASDEAFANYRFLKGGKLPEGKFARSASPCSTRSASAACTDKLAERDGIELILDLGDTEEDILEYMRSENYNSPYFTRLFNEGKVIAMNLGVNYRSEAFRLGLGEGLKKAANTDGRILINCLWGQDRTGMVSALIEALGGATYEELIADYMITFDNFYHVNKKDASEKYEMYIDIYFKDMLCAIAGTEDSSKLKEADYRAGAIRYLESCGMTEEEMEKLVPYNK